MVLIIHIIGITVSCLMFGIELGLTVYACGMIGYAFSNYFNKD